MAAFDAAFRSSYPTLFDFLSLQGMGGKARKTGTLTVFLADGKFKGSLNDREESYTGFASADSFTGLLEALDKGLKSGHLDWRPSRKFKG